MNVPVCERAFNKRMRYFIYCIVGILPDLFMPLWISLFTFSLSFFSRCLEHSHMNLWIVIFFALPLSIFYASVFALNSVDFYVRHVFLRSLCVFYKLWTLQQIKTSLYRARWGYFVAMCKYFYSFAWETLNFLYGWLQIFNPLILILHLLGVHF